MFAVWLTGLPASGKSTIAKALAAELQGRGVRAAILESDVLRRILTPEPTYSEAERDRFYGALAELGQLLAEQGVPVILDATAHRRRYRDRLRADLPRFLEVYVECPLEVCAARDPKGLYRQAREGGAGSLPGAGAEYEAPLRPELVVDGQADPRGEARRIAETLAARGLL